MNKLHFTTDEVYCDKCQQPITKFIRHCFIWSRKQCQEQNYCMRCIAKIKDQGIVMEERNIGVVEMLPEDAFMIFYRPPILTPSTNMTVFEAADKQLGDEKVIDKTNQCHNKNFMIDSDYKPFNIKSLEDKDDGLLFKMIEDKKQKVNKDEKSL